MRVYPQKFYLRQKHLWINSMGKWSTAGGGGTEKTRQKKFEIAGEAFFFWRRLWGGESFRKAKSAKT